MDLRKEFTERINGALFRHGIIQKELSDIWALIESYANIKVQKYKSSFYEDGYAKGYADATTEACKEINKNYTPNK